MSLHTDLSSSCWTWICPMPTASASSPISVTSAHRRSWCWQREQTAIRSCEPCGWVHADISPRPEDFVDLGTTIRRVIAGERVMTPKLEKDAIGALGRMARHAREGADLAASLTTRQQQVLEFLSQGKTVSQIASRLGISPRTVETHVATLYRRLGVKTRVQAVSQAARLGLVDL